MANAQEENNIQDPAQDVEKPATHQISSAAMGAMIACHIAFWAVLLHLLTTQIGSIYSGDSLMSYVIGSSHNIGDNGAEALFIVVTRFLLVFGFSWLPITAIVANNRKSAK